MLRKFTIVAVLAVSLISTTSSKAQDAPATLALSTSRLEDIAMRWAAPEDLPEAIARELEQTYQGLDRKRVDTAVPHWREFLRRRGLLEAGFDPALYGDHLLHRIAVARNEAAKEASRRLRFYDAQENAVFEHVSTVDKLISIYAGEDKPQVPLREPLLSEFGAATEAVTLAPAETADIDVLIASLKRWKDRAPEISEARETARAEFMKAVAADTALSEELRRIETSLRAEIREITVREVTPPRN
jgi:hypothetical protein